MRIFVERRLDGAGAGASGSRYGATASRYTTNSIEVAQSIAAGAISDVTLLGGTLRRNAGTLIGPEVPGDDRAPERSTSPSPGIAAIHPHYGFLDPTEWHAYSGAACCGSNRSKVVLLADHSKFEANSDIRSFDFADVDMLITDRDPPEAYAGRLAEAGIRLLWPRQDYRERR